MHEYRNDRRGLASPSCGTVSSGSPTRSSPPWSEARSRPSCARAATSPWWCSIPNGTLRRPGQLQRAVVHRHRRRRPCRHMLAKFPPETLEPGDVIATNDAWMGTGTPLRHQRDAAGLSRRSNPRVHDEHHPSAGYRRSRVRRRRIADLPRGAPPPHLQARPGGAPRRADVRRHPRQRAGARAGLRRPHGERDLQRGRRPPAPRVHGRVRARGSRHRSPRRYAGRASGPSAIGSRPSPTGRTRAPSTSRGLTIRSASPAGRRSPGRGSASTSRAPPRRWTAASTCRFCYTRAIGPLRGQVPHRAVECRTTKGR